MSKKKQDTYTTEQSAEYLRLALGKLSEWALSLNMISFSVVYSYVSGANANLNEALDRDIKEGAKLTNSRMSGYFQQFVCGCDGVSDEKLQGELLNAVAQILGSIVDFNGKASLSDKSLEHHLEVLAQTRDPATVLKIAAEIIRDTRQMVEASHLLEQTMRETSVQIESLKEELDQAREEATKDTLTGLYNRRGFDIAIQDAVKTLNDDGESFCLLLADVDFFKRVNDTHGHLVGDKVLKGLSVLLHKNMRGSDFIARFGGEEFAIILRGIPITSAFTVAENLRMAVEKLKLKHVKSGKSLDQITVSIGVACGRKGEDFEGLIERCDKALYRAKELGRNRSVIAD